MGRLEGFQLHAVDLPGYGFTDVTSSFSGKLLQNAVQFLDEVLAARLMTRIQPPSRCQVVQLSKMVKQHPLDEELIDLLLETERLPKFRDTQKVADLVSRFLQVQ